MADLMTSNQKRRIRQFICEHNYTQVNKLTVSGRGYTEYVI